jgi:hypothetical protein
MSTSVFSPRGGAVVKVVTDARTSGVFSIKIANAPITLPVTGFALDMATNQQFLHTLNDFIYVHVFGDRIGELTVSGLCFMGETCGSPELSVRRAVQLYNRYRLSREKKGYQVALSDAGTFWGFLTGARIDSVRPDLMMAQWSLRLNVIQQSGGSPAAFGNEFRGGGIDRNP